MILNSEGCKTVVHTTSPPSLRICMSAYLCWISSINTCLAIRVIVALCEVQVPSDPKLDHLSSTVVAIWIGRITKPLPSNDRIVNETPAWSLDLQLWCVLTWTLISSFIRTHDYVLNKWIIHTDQRNHSFTFYKKNIQNFSPLTDTPLIMMLRRTHT